MDLNEPLRDSFNNLEIENHNIITFLSDISFKKRGYYPMMKLMEQACPQEICDEVIRKYRKQFKKHIFEIEVILHSRVWIIRKRVEDFVQLEKTLKDKYKKKIPHMPVKKEIVGEDFDLLQDFFIVFLQSACKIQLAHDDLDLLMFLQVPILYNRSTRIEDVERIKTYIQMYCRKRSGGRYNEYNCRRCIALFTNWKKRFFTITTQGIFYSPGHTQQESSIKQMILFSYDFSMTYGLNETGYKWGINLNGCQRVLHIKMEDWYQFCIFILAVKLSLKQNGYLQNNRFESYAPIRQNCDSRFYIDGQNYFKAVYDEISNAKHQVFITGWMLTPYYMMCRPNSLESQFRLDKLLAKVASRGVKVHIIIFLEPKLALNNDSEYTKFYLQSLHTNIKVLRHPPFVVIPFLWSHHQKIVIIDQKIGFVGGLDICYGRFDNRQHKVSEEENSQQKYWQGADYCNLRISDVYTPRQYQTSLINRNVDPRLPWHDVSVQLRGDSVIDLSRHFIQYWNFVNFQTQFNERQLLIQVGIVLPEIKQQKQMLDQQNEKKQKVHQNRQKLRQQIRKLPKIAEQQIKQKIQGQQVFPELKVKRSISQGLQLIAQIVDKKTTRQISQRYSHVNTQFQHLQEIITVDQKQKQFYRSHLKFEQQKSGKVEKKLEAVQKKIQKKLQKLKKQLTPLNPFSDQEPTANDIVLSGSRTITKGNMRHQLLRSSSSWSMGLRQGLQQRSIYNALISMISNAKNYIYIQNQFFICVQNHVSQAIRQRIQQAVKNKQKFKVIVVLPLLPAFQGQVDSNSSTVLKVQLHWQYETICRGGRSLLQKLSHIQNIDDYIQFYSLRTHGMVGRRPVSQIVYVHSKLTIIDDRVMLIGSANINDRSLLGTRDSEIGIIIEDKDDIEIQKAGEIIKVKKFPYSLRVQLFKQHFGLTDKQAGDLVYDDNIWYMVKERANKNTALYRQVFAVYPDDNVKSLSELGQFQKKKDLHKYQFLKQLVKGNVVQFPQNFLIRQNLKPRPNQKQYYVPQISFT